MNLLGLVAYLIKHGATAFVDEMRTIQATVRRYQEIDNENSDQDLSQVLREVKDRAEYVLLLLNDRQVLWREKEVARLVKEKLALAGGDFSTMNCQKK